MLRNLIANNPEIFRQVTSQQTMSPMQQSSGPIPLGLEHQETVEMQLRKNQ
jgi:hypothetical protein